MVSNFKRIIILKENHGFVNSKIKPIFSSWGVMYSCKNLIKAELFFAVRLTLRQSVVHHLLLKNAMIPRSATASR